MKDILIPVSLPDDAQDPEWENKAIEYAKQALEERLRAEFEKERKPKTLIWEELPIGGGVCIRHDSEIVPSDRFRAGKYSADKNVFRTEKHAKAALAMAQISQLMPYYGGEITDEEWCDVFKTKYTVCRDKGGIDMYDAYSCYEFIAFRTVEDRKRFMSREENVRLVKEYFMID